MPRHVDRYLRNNASSRGGVRPRLCVLHTTEGHNRPGLSDLEGLARFFDDPSSAASAHLGVDAEGNSVRMVRDEDKAWTQCLYNGVSLSVEQVGFSATSKRDWVRQYHLGLYRVALALARWHRDHGIPLRHSTRRGICQHKHLGRAGCGHFDCGPGYPERLVTIWARLAYYRMVGWSKRPWWRRMRARNYKRRVLRQLRRYGAPPTTRPWGE